VKYKKRIKRRTSSSTNKDQMNIIFILSMLIHVIKENVAQSEKVIVIVKRILLDSVLFLCKIKNPSNKEMTMAGTCE
jgi:hypothetical protein